MSESVWRWHTSAPTRLGQWMLGTIVAFSLAVPARAQGMGSTPLEEIVESERLEEISLPAALPASSLPRISVVEVLGSTAFSAEELDAIIAPFIGQEATVENLLLLRQRVTQLYVEEGYATSAAFLPKDQDITRGKIRIQVIEGEVEDIEVRGVVRLHPHYVRDRLRLAVSPPLNIERLERGLQLLLLEPLLETLSAELAAGSSPGLSLLKVKVREADSFKVRVGADNSRSPSVGSQRRGIQVSEANLFGGGERLELNYFNTDGSNSAYLGFTFPVSARNGTVRLVGGVTFNDIIEEPFNQLDLETESRYYEVSFRQPVVRTPFQELALGVTLSRIESESFLGGIPFPLSRGADDRGRTRISALRFFQEWAARSEREVITVRSQVSLGLEALEATVAREPDAEFFDWFLQGQYVRLLAPDTLLLLRGELQLADQPLLPDEQFRLGGFDSVRGYRQDLLLSDNGFFASAEVRLPVLRIPEWQAVLQVAPFIDVGKGWNNSDFPLDPNTLTSVGLGLRWQQGNSFNASFYWGIPLVEVGGEKRTLQENGLYFYVEWFPF